MRKQRFMVFAAAMGLAGLVTTPAVAAPGDDPIADHARHVLLADQRPKHLAPGAEPGIVALMTKQEKLDKVAERIEKVATDTATSGLGGIVVDAKAGSLDLYWHGARSTVLDREVAAARKAGLTVRVTPAPYTRKALRQEADRLAGTYMTSTTGVVRSVEAKPDGSGLLVGVAGGAARSRAVTPPASSSVPLEFTAATPQKTDRWYDTYPYWGGALLINYLAPETDWENYWGMCTSGFGVTGLNGAATYMMFANHCGEGNWRTGMVSDSSGAIHQNQLGNTIPTRDVAHDTQLILTPQGSGAGAYTGESWLGSGQSGRSVKGSAGSNVGDYICTEGSYSGTVCDIRVVGTGATINVTDYGQMRDMVRSNHIYYRGAAGNGDSGGPVVSVTSGGVIARGTISAISLDTVVDCYGVAGVPADQDGRHCAWQMYYPDIRFQLAGVGVRLNTQ